MSLSTFSALRVIVNALAQGTPTTVVGVDGGLKGLVLAQAMTDPASTGPIIYVAEHDAHARAIASDVEFFVQASSHDLDSRAKILRIPEIDVSPYADVAADPRVIARRLGALARLSQPELRLIIVSVESLRRKVIEQEAFENKCQTWQVGQPLDRDVAIEDLLRTGFGRVDIVEDPGNFAVRGGVVDIFVPTFAYPVRVEWLGDQVESIRLFDSSTQRSLREIDRLVLHPVRETLRERGVDYRPKVNELGDRIEVPSSRTRQVNENLIQGVDFFGMEALVPIFHDGLVPLWQHFPANARWIVENVDQLIELAEEQEAEVSNRHAQAIANRALVCEPEQFFVNSAEFSEHLLHQPMVWKSPLSQLHHDPLERQSISVRLASLLPLRTQLAGARAERHGDLLGPLIGLFRALDPDIDDVLLTTEANLEEPGEEVEREQKIHRLSQEIVATWLDSLDSLDSLPWQVVLVASTTSQADRLVALLRNHQIDANIVHRIELSEHTRAENIGPENAGNHSRAQLTFQVSVVKGLLSAGFCAPDERILYLSEFEIFGKTTRRVQSNRVRTLPSSLSQLKPDDFVVHLSHGVGKYVGLIKLQMHGIAGDFVAVEYARGDKLYLPVHRISEIERYTAAEGKEPKLDRMGGQSFAMKAARVRTDVRQLAEELLQLYAQRESQDGYSHDLHEEECGIFAATFPFEETVDQAQAIQAVEHDLSICQPMDRLICGDVGFGKTEVAIRAAFRVATGGKQVAILAPTTVLVQQHYMTFVERMREFPIHVACLNRFSSATQRKNTVEKIRQGQVDIVIGTHRLLSSDVRFKNLGLVVIDEEQRFGVRQKERFKRLKTQVDVLTLSATPIPRTLHMSLLGLREISMITTPPVDRLSVRTWIIRSSEVAIKEAIERELARGGQVYYVVPRVLGIEEYAQQIRKIVPQARVLVAHGQMPASMLEQTMLDFVEHKADILVATSIIESGLDIPRANTMFIARSDCFGLAQIYQLRGRIGRSKVRAHCYLMVESLERLSESARRRLDAIQRCAELGSGFNVASQDLEIRGAGDLLGKKQSGNITAIGFPAFVRILEEAVAELQGQPLQSEQDPELNVDIPGFLPDDFVEDVGQRLDFYRRLSQPHDADQVRHVMEELYDRYGSLPLEARHYCLMMVCKTYARQLGALALEISGGKMTLRFADASDLKQFSTDDAFKRVQEWQEVGLRLAGPDRIVGTLPNRSGEDCERQFLACEDLLRALMRARTRPMTN